MRATKLETLASEFKKIEGELKNSKKLLEEKSNVSLFMK